VRRPLSVRICRSLISEVDVAREDIEQAVARKHLLPEIGRAVVTVHAGRISGTVVVPLVERQPVRRLAVELGRHEDEIGIDSEVDERTLLEAEQRKPRVAVVLVLALGVLDVLAGHRVLEFRGDDRNAIDGEHDVDALLACRVELHLPRDGEDVLGVGRDRLGVHARGRLERGHLEGLAKALEAVAQDGERALRGQLLAQCIEQHGLGRLALKIDEGLPLLGLRDLHVGDDVGGEQAEVGIVGLRIALGVATRKQLDLDRVLEPGLGVLAARAHWAASFCAASRTLILPVTALVMRAERYSVKSATDRSF